MYTPLAGVFLAAEDMAQGLRDIGRGKGGGRDLVKQGLEEVVVRFVHQGHCNLVAGEGAGGFQPGEAAADDEHSGLRCRGWG